MPRAARRRRKRPQHGRGSASQVRRLDGSSPMVPRLTLIPNLRKVWTIAERCRSTGTAEVRGWSGLLSRPDNAAGSPAAPALRRSGGRRPRSVHGSNHPIVQRFLRFGIISLPPDQARTDREDRSLGKGLAWRAREQRPPAGTAPCHDRLNHPSPWLPSSLAARRRSSAKAASSSESRGGAGRFGDCPASSSPVRRLGRRAAGGRAPRLRPRPAAARGRRGCGREGPSGRLRAGRTGRPAARRWCRAIPCRASAPSRQAGLGEGVPDVADEQGVRVAPTLLEERVHAGEGIARRNHGLGLYSAPHAPGKADTGRPLPWRARRA